MTTLVSFLLGAYDGLRGVWPRLAPATLSSRAYLRGRWLGLRLGGLWPGRW